MKIAIDVMGGAFAPQNPVGGIKLALAELPRIEKLFLVGVPEVIQRELDTQGVREPSNCELGGVVGRLRRDAHQPEDARGRPARRR